VLHNDGNYIISLGQLCRWLATQAEELGVEIYPGFSASEVRKTHTHRARACLRCHAEPFRFSSTRASPVLSLVCFFTFSSFCT
jgi:hypothetical protein